MEIIFPKNLRSVGTAGIYDVKPSDDVVLCATVLGNVVVNLGPARARAGRPIRIILSTNNANNYPVEVWYTGGEIDGSIVMPRRLSLRFESVLLLPINDDYFIIERRIPSSWTAFTPVITHASGGASNVSHSGRWRRNDDGMEVQTASTFSAASANFSDWRIGIPSGFFIDHSKLAGNNQPLGIARITDTGVLNFPSGQVLSVPTLNTEVLVRNLGVSGSYINDTLITQDAPFAFNSGDVVYATFKVPIVGWEG